MFMIQSEIQSNLRYSRATLEKVCAIDPQTKRCQFNWLDDAHRSLLRGLISTSASLAMYAKPYRIASKLCLRQMEELFNEGDAVRKLGLTPVPIMNRDVSMHIPEWHLKLLHFLQPCFMLLQNVLPETAELMEGAKYERAKRVFAVFMHVINALHICFLCLWTQFAVQVLARGYRCSRSEDLVSRHESSEWHLNVSILFILLLNIIHPYNIS